VLEPLNSINLCNSVTAADSLLSMVRITAQFFKYIRDIAADAK